MIILIDLQNKKQQSVSNQTGGNPPVKSGAGDDAPSFNGLETDSNPIPSLLSGDMSLDDPSLSDGQRDVVIKYLKHVVLSFLSCGQSEVRLYLYLRSFYSYVYV